MELEFPDLPCLPQSGVTPASPTASPTAVMAVREAPSARDWLAQVLLWGLGARSDASLPPCPTLCLWPPGPGGGSSDGLQVLLSGE